MTKPPQLLTGAASNYCIARDECRICNNYSRLPTPAATMQREPAHGPLPPSHVTWARSLTESSPLYTGEAGGSAWRLIQHWRRNAEACGDWTIPGLGFGPRDKRERNRPQGQQYREIPGGLLLCFCWSKEVGFSDRNFRASTVAMRSHVLRASHSSLRISWPVGRLCAPGRAFRGCRLRLLRCSRSAAISLPICQSRTRFLMRAHR